MIPFAGLSFNQIHKAGVRYRFVNFVSQAYLYIDFMLLQVAGWFSEGPAHTM